MKLSYAYCNEVVPLNICSYMMSVMFHHFLKRPWFLHLLQDKARYFISRKDQLCKCRESCDLDFVLQESTMQSLKFHMSWVLWYVFLESSLLIIRFHTPKMFQTNTIDIPIWFGYIRLVLKGTRNVERESISDYRDCVMISLLW